MSGEHVRERRRRLPRARWWLLGIAVIALGLLGAGVARVEVAWSVPSPRAGAVLQASLRQVPEPAGGPIPWPTSGEAAMTIPGVITFAPTGGSAPVPIASITKVMTTLVLLKDKPLTLGQQGPSMTIDAAEVAQTAADAAAKDSYVPVTLGEQITEYQMIEAMLVPSADNIAEMVAVWDAGTEQAFVNEMNALASQWGLTATHFTDASGLAAGSVSNASNLLVLGQRAMANPVIASVVAMSRVSLPGSPSPAFTYDFDLGEDGVVGIKPGSDGPAGGCFLFAATVAVDGHSELAYGAVLGQQSSTSVLDKAMSVSIGLIKGLNHVLAGETLVRREQRVGSLVVPWSHPVPLVAADPVSVVAPPGSPVETSVTFDHLRSNRSVAAGTTVGLLRIRVGKRSWRVPIDTQGPVGKAPLGWLLGHW